MTFDGEHDTINLPLLDRATEWEFRFMIIVKDRNGYLISDIIDGYRVARRYVGHTKRYAQQLFRREIKQLNKGDK